MGAVACLVALRVCTHTKHGALQEEVDCVRAECVHTWGWVGGGGGRVRGEGGGEGRRRQGDGGGMEVGVKGLFFSKGQIWSRTRKATQYRTMDHCVIREQRSWNTPTPLM